MARPLPHHRRHDPRLRRSRPLPTPRIEWRSADFLALVALLLLCALGGGSAFADTLPLLVVRPAAVAALALFLFTPGRADWRSLRAPLLMLAALALLMAAQLVPLPPALWLALPGRAPYAEAAAAAGVAQPWRPLSLTPDLTANSLVALVVPAAVLVGFARIGEEQRRWLAVALAALCGASAVLGVAQFVGGEGSALYLYKRTHDGFPVGLLANRNHQAALLALAFPALRVWTLRPAATPAAARSRQWLALALGAFVVPVILATGSRTGIVIAAASIAVTFALLPVGAGGGRRARLLRFGVPALLLVLVLVSYRLGRAASIERISSLSAIEADQRFQLAPVVAGIIRDSFPIGTGFGSFDPVFRQYEPDAILTELFVNHAHNDLLELAMTAGLPGLLLLATFLGWWATRLVAALRGPEGAARPYALLGGVAVAVLLAASLVDYPLRTPLLEAVFALACGWLCPRRTRAA